jgi:hypothetical protein
MAASASSIKAVEGPDDSLFIDTGDVAIFELWFDWDGARDLREMRALRSLINPS